MDKREDDRRGDADEQEDRDGESSRPEQASRPAGASLFKLHKPGQGTYVRWCTAVGGAILALAGAQFLYERLSVVFVGDHPMRLVIPIIALAGLAYLVWWMTGANRTSVEFMIATEAEMKKVNWSSRKEVIGATKVVILTVLAMSVLLFAIDIISIAIFSMIGIYKVSILSQMFGGTPK